MRANLLACEEEAAIGQVFNIATGRGVSLLELMEELSGLLGVQIQPEFQGERAGDIKHSRGDGGLIAKTLLLCASDVAARRTAEFVGSILIIQRGLVWIKNFLFIPASPTFHPKRTSVRAPRSGSIARCARSAVIGENCILSKGVYVDAGVRIGNNVKIQNGISVYHGVTLEDGVFCGPHCVFTNDRQPRAINPDGTLKSADDWVVSETLVKTGASIGAHATIVCGTTIGRWAMIGAGSVVTRDVPDYGLVYGNPARLHGFVCACGEKLEESDITSRSPRHAQVRSSDRDPALTCRHKVAIPCCRVSHGECLQIKEP